MRSIIYCCVALSLISGCKKESSSKVEIYILTSFTISIDQTPVTFTSSISNAVPDRSPLVADADIKYYTKATTTFKLNKDIKPLIKNFGPEKAFAVTVDGKPVYFGKFHPSYLSSITLGLATIDPTTTADDELTLNFATVTGSALAQLDKRNDPLILNALKATGRLR